MADTSTQTYAPVEMPAPAEMSAAPGIDKAGDQADDLAAWVAQLRHGMSVPNLRRGKGGQLSRLGRELQLVADSLQGRECELREPFDLMS